MAFIENPLNLREVNHKNGIKHDNRLGNLEWVTSSENTHHAYRNNLQKNHRGKKPSNNTSGQVGVVWIENRKRYVARIGYGGKMHTIGYFKTIKDATLAYNNKLKDIK